MVVEKTLQFLMDLEATVMHIAQDNVLAAMAFEELIHNQVDSLADPNFPRRQGRVAGTLELVAHSNYVVVLQQSNKVVTALALLHVARQYP
jgi:plasmid stabilization system protein ParE